MTLVLLGAGCLHQSPDTGSTPDRGVITHEQLIDNHFNTAYDAVETLRSNWLSARGPDSFQNPSIVQVYLDETALGGVDALRDIPANTVSFIRFFDGISATARWGVGHSAGVIFVSRFAANPDTNWNGMWMPEDEQGWQWHGRKP